MGISTNDRRIALGVARSLQSQLFFYEVEWGGRQLTDSVEDVYMFLDDQEGVSNELQDQEELPTAVITILTKCYSLSCSEGLPCYSSRCPRRAAVSVSLPIPPCCSPTNNTPHRAFQNPLNYPLKLLKSP